MKKPVVVALGAVAAVLLVATAVLFAKYRTATADYVALQTEEQATRNRYGLAINEIAMIQDSLNAIALGEEGAQALTQELSTEQRLSQTRGDEVLGRIAIIKAGIERTKDRIGELDAKLKKSNIKASGLQRMIANLKQTVSEREVLVADLTTRVETLQTQVTGLTAEVEQNHTTITNQAESIEGQRKELGTIYYAIGSKKDLTEAGLAVAKGGVLGIGKTLEATGQIDETRFTPLDTDAETVIQIPSDKAQVVSDQPAGSYVLQTVGDKMELHILNPQQFRTVKHLVIVTT